MQHPPDEDEAHGELWPQTRIGPVAFFAGGLDEAVHIVVSRTLSQDEKRKSKCISATGAHGVVTSIRDPQFSNAIKSFWANLPDGIPAVWVGRLKGMKKMERCYGPSFFELVMKGTSKGSAPYYLCGGKPGVADQLAGVCASRFGNKQCVGVFSPPFRDMSNSEWIELANSIESSCAKVVWIGLSTPKQELFAADLAKRVKVNFIITIGAAFDFHTGRLKQAPKWIQAMGLEWLFRLVVEPKRLLGRYAVVVPTFLSIALFELASFYARKIKIAVIGSSESDNTG